MKILLGRSICIAEVCEVGHTTGQEVLLETLPDGRIGSNRTVQFNELPKGKRIDHKLHIPTGQICCKLTGQQLCIRAGYIDVTIKRDTERVDAFLPVFDLLYFVKEQIDLALCFCGSLGDLVMQSLSGLQMGSAHIFKVDRDKLCRTYTGLRKFLFD